MMTSGLVCRTLSTQLDFCRTTREVYTVMRGQDPQSRLVDRQELLVMVHTIDSVMSTVMRLYSNLRTDILFQSVG